MLRTIPRAICRRYPVPWIAAIPTSRSMVARFHTHKEAQAASIALPSDSFQLLSTSEKAGSAGDALFEEQVQEVKDWWNTPRYEGIKRPYSAEDVVGKRGTLQQTYPSSLMAKKLFNLLKERAAHGQPVHTSKHPADLMAYSPSIVPSFF